MFTVVPVSVAIMSPIPMIIIYIIQKIMGCLENRKHKHKKIVDEDTPVSETPEPIGISTIEGDKDNNNEP